MKKNIISYNIPHILPFVSAPQYLSSEIARVESLIKRTEQNIIDLSKVTFITPLGILPLAAKLSLLEDEGFYVSYMEPSTECSEYLKTIRFMEKRDLVLNLLSRQMTSYIPIVSIPSSDKQRERLVSAFEKILYQHVGCNMEYRNAIAYLLNEIFVNIWEHSQSPSGWINAQYYASPEELDICIIDCGIAIKGSYSRMGIHKENDLEALNAALRGESSKKEEERGYGIPTTYALATRSVMAGEFLLLSGSSAYWANSSRVKLFNFRSWRWNGTILALKLRKVQKIDIYKYVEGNV